jgi:hypothetical protein
MTGSSAFTFAIVCEGHADFQIATELADRLLCQQVDWIDRDVLTEYRRWQGFHLTDSFLTWKAVPELAKERNLKSHGRFGEELAAPYAHAARRALLVLHSQSQPPHAILLIIDTDHEDRRSGFEQARSHYPASTPIVLGAAHPNRECWVLAGFEPANEKERRRLSQLERELSFNPLSQPERLNSGKEQETRSAKRVLAQLTGGDPEREKRCWCECDLETLKERGKATGLTDYLEELQERLLPLFSQSGAQPRSS